MVTTFTSSVAQRSCARNTLLLLAKLMLLTRLNLSSSSALSEDKSRSSSKLQFLFKGDLSSNLFLRLFCFGDNQVGTCLELYSLQGSKSSLK